MKNLILKPYQILFVLLLSFLTTACISNMRVKVEVMDRTKTMASPQVALLEVLSISEVESARLGNNYYIKQRDDINSIFNVLFDTLIKRKNLDQSVRSNLQADMAYELDSIYLKIFIPKVSDAISKVSWILNERTLPAESLSQPQIDRILQAKNAFVSANQLLNASLLKLLDLESGWVKIFNLDTPENSQLKTYLTNNIINPVLQSALKANIGADYIKLFHNGLFDDPLNSIVVQAPKSHWRKMYNKAVAKNFMGNTDIAVVMETPGNFFIKGVRMDAEDVTSTIAKTFNTSVKLVAKLNGLPMNPKQVVDTTSTTRQVNAVADQLNALKIEKEMEIRERSTKLSAIGLMDAILAQKDSLNSESGYKEALKQIKSIYTVHKTQLTTFSNK